MTEFSEKVMKKLERIHQYRKISMEKLKEQILVSAKKLEATEQFSDLDQRVDYAANLLLGTYMTGTITEEFDVIPVGFSGIRTEKSGKPRSEIYSIITIGDKARLRLIVCRGEGTADLYKSVSLGAKYNKINLGIFKDSDDLIATPQTTFNGPEETDFMDNYEAYFESLGVPRVNVANLTNNLSKKTSTGYVDRTDWRLVRGMISRFTIWERKDKEGNPTGEQGGVMNIFDPESDQVTEDGFANMLTIWAPPEQLIYPAQSMVDVLGTVETDDKGVLSMSAYLIVPVHIFQDPSLGE